MTPDQLLDRWHEEEVPLRSGWTFDQLGGRVHDSPTPWNYPELCRTEIMAARRLLDLGTGGGEFLLGFLDVLPPDTTATEGWLPNIDVAAQALEPHGIDVVVFDAQHDDELPFPDERFDLVINRHEAYVATEVARVLAPGGVYLTKQVGGDDFAEAHELFGAPVLYPDHQLTACVRELEEAGLVLDMGQEWRGPTTFDDVGALVQYFMMVPWDVPDDFSVSRYADTLMDLHERGPAQGMPIIFTESRFVMRAHKPG